MVSQKSVGRLRRLTRRHPTSYTSPPSPGGSFMGGPVLLWRAGTIRVGTVLDLDFLTE
jgi:hypothetical protein